jgi:predicted RNA polymerase sigma factor
MSLRPWGLLALMLLHEARRATRVDASGDLILLENQNRSLWDRKQIAEAQGLIERAFRFRFEVLLAIYASFLMPKSLQRPRNAERD